MTAVRPDLPMTPLPAAPVSAGAKAAQAAFFRAALDRAQAPAALTSAPTITGAEPRHEQRPGALLDIRV